MNSVDCEGRCKGAKGFKDFKALTCCLVAKISEIMRFFYFLINVP